MDPSQTPGQDPFLNDAIRNSQYDSLSSAFNPTPSQSTNEFPKDPRGSSAPQEQPQEDLAPPFRTQPPARQRMPQSPYYMFFSVTGIERSNAKNPIVRFDAKVTFPRGLKLFRIKVDFLFVDQSSSLPCTARP